MLFRSVWTERMLSALESGVKGGKWFSLMDKVFAPKTLATAWTKVRANKGAAGVDGQSIERFAARSDDYLAELSAALQEGTYLPQAVRRVDIPKGANTFALCARGAGHDRWAFRHGLHTAPLAVRVWDDAAIRVELATRLRNSRSVSSVMVMA